MHLSNTFPPLIFHRLITILVIRSEGLSAWILEDFSPHYKPRTSGGEFARGFEDGYDRRGFTGQKHIVADRYRPYTTNGCDWY